MAILSTPEEVDAWLAESGWHPGRDIGDQAQELMRTVMERYQAYGVRLEPTDTATAFVREHGLLRPLIDDAPENIAVLTPHLVFKGEAEEISELASDLGVKLFPVGYDSYDGAVILVDESGRFFFYHHTGAYYLGSDKYEAFISLLSSRMEDAEDYFV
ncbi:SUKH-3 domain-containing protein [Streptomyces sp. AK02-01A]|uniref:SUKH-3 domain-containing protein n=1 Tax=Streptomyces sp. AK02-01A TaxID=3028648 RepID=UPI0029BE92D4|nr:SUKH-3 domain-containing protein [Streptomyces sp. AK02-01A]MDX3850285.1 SUKH-3 domain-containing protein [Streptomyces sp. AK02-01A]